MRVRVVSYNEMNKYNVKHIINTTSRSKEWSREFSPFLLGPVNLYQAYVSKNMENAWQYSKVYPEHADENQNPTEEYFKWARNGWKEERGHRYPMEKGRIPLYSYWDGEKLDYIQSRKRIYAPLYAQAVLNTDAFKRLLDIYESGDSFVLVDFDGYDYLAKGMTLEQVRDEPNKKMGHAFVLAMLLEYPKLREKYRG